MKPISIFCFVTLVSIGLNQIPGVQGDLVSDACSKALYKDLCEKTLRDDASSQTANLDGLDKIALKAAASSAKDIQAEVASLLKTAADKSVKKALQDCTENYDSANDQLSDSLTALDAKSYADVKTWVSAAMSDGDSCQDGLKSASSALTQANTNFGQLCSNVLALTNQLG